MSDTQPIDYVRTHKSPADIPSPRAVWHVASESPLGHLVTFACRPDSHYPAHTIMTTAERPKRVCGECRQVKGL